MDKPLDSGIIYKKISTTTQIPVSFANASDSDKAAASQTVQKILDLIVLDN